MSADANTPVPEKQHWKQHWAEAVAECITDEQEALRIVGFYEDGEWQPAMLSIGRENLAIKRELAALAADVEKLSAFKAFVHEFLDRNGVPTDPPGKMREEGCRVGQRLKYLADERAAARARVAELEAIAAMLDAVVQGAQEEFVRVPYGASHEDVAAINDWHKMAREARALLSPSPEPTK